jgi:stage II sporulation protein D
MRRSAHAALAAAAALLACAPAHAASKLTIKGAGYGHGVGMSQFGALGYAQHGAGYRDILGHYYANTSIGRAPDGNVVRVLLQSPKSASFTGATKAGDRRLQPQSVYRVTSTLDNRLVLRSSTNRRLKTFDAPLTVTGAGGPLTLRGKATNGVRDGAYRGWLEFRPSAVGNVLAINAVGLEQYLAGVVAAESPSNWPPAALQAQAVAARTYAITTSAGGSLGFTQYADTRSQMYRGIASETASTNAAINATAGEVVTYNNKPVTTYFFSTSGGRTENVEESVLGTTPRPWLRSVDDPYDNVSPYHRWNVKMTMKQAAKKLGKSLVKGSFQGIVVVERGASPRVRAADVVGSKGRVRTTGAVLRRKLALRDTWAYFTAISSHKSDPEKSTPSPDASGGTSPAARAAAADAGGVLAGRIVPVRRAAEVRVQRRVGRSWKLAAVTLAGRGGVYRTTVPGPGVYRVVARGVVGPAVRVGR